MANISWPENCKARARAHIYLQIANIILSFLCNLYFQEYKGLFLLALVSPLSLSQADRSSGHRQEKGVHCTRPQAGHLSLDATSADPRGKLAAGTSFPMHPSQCHILCRWSYWPPFLMYRPCWHCPGQRAEHRGFPTLCLPSLGHTQAWGFSIGLERGWWCIGRGP